MGGCCTSGQNPFSASSGRWKRRCRAIISAPTLLGRLLIAPLLAEFLRRYPQLAVDLLLVDRTVDMVEEDIHLEMRVGHLPDSQLVVRKLADLKMIVCASPAYLERRGTPQVPADLTGHDCLVFSDAPGIAEWRFGERAKAQRKIRISARLWMNSLDALVTAAKQGAGVVRVPSWQVETDIASGALQRLLRDHEPPPTPLHLLLGPSRLSQSKCRVFVDYLVEQWRVANPFGAQHACDPSE
jgi:DNA-binding transcriptional LysR family regulator